MQVSIDLDRRGTCRGCSVRRLSDQWTRPADFPAINPNFANRKNRFVYTGGASGSRRFLPYFPFDSVVKIDASDGSARSWSTAGRKFVGEPVFVPTGGREDNGYVIFVEVTRQQYSTHATRQALTRILNFQLTLSHLMSLVSLQYAVSDHRCNLVVLDARKIGERNALVAKLEVPKHLTFAMGFHGFWADE
jgi:9-cis-beta-carotene 9',10'-cleaving dioxygenase